MLTGEYGDMVAQGIIDPAKVTRSALENAASIAGMILTTEALITDIPEEEPAMPRRRRRHGRHGLLKPAPSAEYRVARVITNPRACFRLGVPLFSVRCPC